MERDPSCKANSFSASQEILHILRTQVVHSHMHNILPLLRILMHINIAHALFTLLKDPFNIILPSTPSSSK